VTRKDETPKRESVAAGIPVKEPELVYDYTGDGIVNA